MALNVYACLIGKWECLNSDPHCVIDRNSDPVTWWKEQGDKMFDYDYVNIEYNDKHYQIHPSFIQIVHE